jgi:hypothetical protein
MYMSPTTKSIAPKITGLPLKRKLTAAADQKSIHLLVTKGAMALRIPITPGYGYMLYISLDAKNDLIPILQRTGTLYL